MQIIGINAVIFDLDGTLLDTIEDIADSMNSVLENRGYPVHDIPRYRTFVGAGLSVFVKKALPVDCSDETIEKCLEAMKTKYANNCAKKTKPFPGITELLRELLNKKIRISVLSNKLDEATKAVVKEYFPDFPFDIVLGARPNIPLKPDPTAANEISAKLHLAPEEIVFVGDCDVDMQTAVNAGNYPIGVLWGYQTASILEINGAKNLLHKPAELLSLIS